MAHLADDDLQAARQALPSLCGRDPTNLDATEMTRAVIESVAENTSDAIVAPLLWGAVAGLPGLTAYRAINTLDAMIGYRSDRYLNFGWASARLDDAANWRSRPRHRRPHHRLRQSSKSTEGKSYRHNNGPSAGDVRPESAGRGTS